MPLSNFNIPDSCKTGNTVFKKLFYDNGDLGTADKDLLTVGVDKIMWQYCLKPETIHIKPYKDDIRDYPEIEVLEVILSSDAKLKRLAEIIMRTIPYPMLLIFWYNGKISLWTAHQRINQNDTSKNTLEDFIHTDWLFENDGLFGRLDISQMNMTNLYTLYCGIVDAISICNAQRIAKTDELTGEQARRLTEQVQQLDAEIARLNAKLKKETQFNRRVEINLEIKRLERKKEDYEK